MQTRDVDSLTCDEGRVPRRDGVAWGVWPALECFGVMACSHSARATWGCMGALSERRVLASCDTVRGPWAVWSGAGWLREACCALWAGLSESGRDGRRWLFDLRRGMEHPSAWWWAFGLGCEAPVSRRWH